MLLKKPCLPKERGDLLESFLIGVISWIQDECQIVPCFHPLLDLPESFFSQPTGPVPLHRGSNLPGRNEHYPGVG